MMNFKRLTINLFFVLTLGVLLILSIAGFVLTRNALYLLPIVVNGYGFTLSAFDLIKEIK